MLRRTFRSPIIASGATLALLGLVTVGCGSSSKDDLNTQTQDEEPEPAVEEQVDAGVSEPEPTDADDDTEPGDDEPPVEEPVPEEPTPVVEEPTPQEPTPQEPAPVEPVPEPTPDEPEPVPEPVVTPDTGILWQFIQTDVGAYVHNILGDGTQTPITSQVDTVNGLVPWSPDGTEMAQLVDGEVVFYTLGDAVSIAASYPGAQYDSLVGWIPGFGALLTGTDGTSPFLGAMKPDGTEVVLSSDPASLPPAAWSVAPDGSEVVWTAATSNEDGSTTMSEWHSSLSNGEASAPELLGVAHQGSPILSPTWTPDGAFFAYGLSDQYEGGVYIWQRGAATPTRVSPDDASYNPLYSFSPDGSQFVLYASSPTGGGLYTVTTSPSGVSTPRLVDSSAEVSPAYWNGFGALTFQDADSGWYLPVADDGTHGEPIALLNYSWGCDHWVNESQFFLAGCTEGSTLGFGTVANGAITVTEVAPTALGQLLVGPDGTCMAEWSNAELKVGFADPETYAATPATMSGSVQFPQFTADGTHLVYIALGVSIQYITLESCAPVGEPLQIVASGIVQNTVLLPQ